MTNKFVDHNLGSLYELNNGFGHQLSDMDKFNGSVYKNLNRFSNLSASAFSASHGIRGLSAINPEKYKGAAAIEIAKALKHQHEIWNDNVTPYMRLMKQKMYGASAWANITKNNLYFSQFGKITRSFRKKIGLIDIRTKFPKVSPEEVYDRVIKNGGICLLLEHDHWILLLSNSPVDKELIYECRKSRKFRLKDIAYAFYSRNNHKNIFRKLDYLLSYDYENNQVKLTGGYHDQIRRVKKLLQEDFSNSEVLVSTVMTWIEYAVAARFGVVEDNNGFKLGGKIQHFGKTIDKTSISKFDANVLSYDAVFSYLDDLWDPNLQKFADGRENIGIGRHSVQHGRVDPKRYTEETMEKLICLIYALVKLPDIEKIKMTLAA